MKVMYIILLLLSLFTNGLLGQYAWNESSGHFQYKRAYEALRNNVEEMHRTVWGRVSSAYVCKKRFNGPVRHTAIGTVEVTK